MSRYGNPVSWVILDNGGFATNAGALSFSLSGVLNNAEMRAMWDQYRLNCVVVRFTYHQQASQSGQITFPTPILHYAIDHTDSSGAAVSPADLKEYSTYRQVQLKNAMTIKIKIFPRWQGVAYKTVASVGYRPNRGWLATDDYTVPHYGLKYAVDASQCGGSGELQVGNMTVDAKYYLQFKEGK